MHDLPVSLEFSGGVGTPALLSDLSLGGARVMPYFEHLEVGAEVRMRFPQAPERPITAHVIWVAERPSTTAGLRFTIDKISSELVRLLAMDADDAEPPCGAAPAAP